MTKRIFIAATNTDIGKTYTTKLLLQEFAARGVRVGVIKPVETGVVDGKCPDGDALLALVQQLNPEFQEVTIKDVVPIQHPLPAAPYVASGGKALDLAKIDASVDKLEKFCDLLLFEGAGGLLVPIDAEYMMIDLIKHYKADALLVTHCSLGCINDTLLSKQLLDHYKITNRVVFNCKDHKESFAKISEPYFVKSGFEVMKLQQDIDKVCDLLYNPS